MERKEIKKLLDEKVNEYNRVSFIENDPILIPHQFHRKQDIEIAAFFAAIFAWGNRKIIIHKSNDLMQRMDFHPYDFIMQGTKNSLKQISGFKHRTFSEDDIYFFISFLRIHYQKYSSLEDAFIGNGTGNQRERLIHFYNYVFHLPHLKRSEKHISTPAKNSACKRLNMLMRWMVRRDERNVDFGLWKQIKMSELKIPLDIHVLRTASRLGLLKDSRNTWKQVEELTEILKGFNSRDPVKYDFALFGLGVFERSL